MKVIIKNPMLYLKSFSSGIIFFCISLFALASSNNIEIQEEFNNALLHVNFSELTPEIREKLMRAYELSLIKKSQLKKTESVALFVSEGTGLKVEKEEKAEPGLGLWQNDLKLAVGRVKSCFKDYSPTYGSGVLIDPCHILTLASCVLNGSLPPKRITFFSYCTDKEQYIKEQEVCSIRVPSSYSYMSCFTDKKQPNNYILLTLKEEINSFGRDWIFPFINYTKMPLNLQYKLYGFKETLPYLEEFSLESFIEKDEQFLVYKSSTPLGSGGAPLVILDNDNDRYFLAGLHLGLHSVRPEEKIALKFTPQIQQSIRCMIIEEQELQTMASSQSKARSFPKQEISCSGSTSTEALDSEQQEHKGREKAEILPKVSRVQEEREGMVLKKEIPVSTSSEINAEKKDPVSGSKGQEIFKVEKHKKNVDAYLKVAFAPNLLSLMERKFIGLDASNTDITKEGLELLPKTFKALNLENCQQITDEALEVLKQFKKLKELNLDGCPITLNTLNTLNILKKHERFFHKEDNYPEKALKQEQTQLTPGLNLSKEASSLVIFSQEEELQQLIQKMNHLLKGNPSLTKNVEILRESLFFKHNISVCLDDHSTRYGVFGYSIEDTAVDWEEPLTDMLRDKKLEGRVQVGINGTLPSFLKYKGYWQNQETVKNPDRDERQAVLQPSWPYNTSVRLLIEFPKMKIIGSGTIVLNNRTILTAGHCIYDQHKGGFADSIIVEYRNEQNNEWCYKKGEAGVIVSGWLNEHKPSCDYGLIILKESIGINCMGLAIEDEIDNLYINTAGFPKKFKDRIVNTFEDDPCLYATFGVLKKGRCPLTLYHTADIAGQSGSGLWTYDRDHRAYCCGIHTAGFEHPETDNKGLRISSISFQRICQWINHASILTITEESS